MNSDSSVYLDEQASDCLGADVLSIALIGPNEQRRKEAADALARCQGGEIREFSSYPASLDDVPKLLEPYYDVIIIDLDTQPEYALDLVECFCANCQATVMVYSVKTDSELLVRCMRAGAREFLTLPLAHNSVAEALVRAAARRAAIRPPKKAGGRLLAFLGAKGGDGVTTLACNFAVSLAQESSQSTLLIDLDLPLGDAALNLGVSAEYSAINALQNARRLDSSFLSKLLVKHNSGVSVLAAPGKFPQFEASDEAVDRLIAVARQDFDNVVIDMGSRLDLMGTSLFKDGSTIYLVIQTGIAGLRNSNRLISQYFSTEIPKLEIVLNRYQPRSLGVAEDQITKALTRPAQWKIPNDYAAVRRMQHTAIPLALEDSPISRLIRQMARSACGLPVIQEKGTGFSLKKIGRSISSKMSTSDDSPTFAQLCLTADQQNLGTIPAATRLIASQPKIAAAELPAIEWPTPVPISDGMESSSNEFNAAASVPGTFEYTPAAGELLPAGENAHSVTFTPADSSETRAQTAVSLSVVRTTPIIAWATPAPIDYGAPLNATQLNAMASIPGTFVYTPASGELLPAGENTLSVIFTPTDAEDHTRAYATVQLTVTPATPEITWLTPASISYGTLLSVVQLNATSSVPGRFDYTPAAGMALPAGVQTLSVAFIPADDSSYTAAKAAVPLTVTRATPLIMWPNPADIVSGVALGDTELNATALVQGSFVYSHTAGEVLEPGTHTLSVTFIPADTESFNRVQVSVPLIVSKAKTVAIWPMPPVTSDDALLSAAQPFIESQPETATVVTAEVKKPAAQAKPTHKNAAAVKAPAKPTVKVTKEAPTGAWVKLPAMPPEETPANALVKATIPKSPIDVGPGLDLMGSAVFEDGTTIYLVLQPGTAGIENANRLVSQFFAAGGPKPEMVISRYDPGAQGVSEGQTSTALTRPSYSPISRLIGQMARLNFGQPVSPEKETGFSLRGFGKKLWARFSTTEKPPSIMQLGSLANLGEADTPAFATPPEESAKIAGTLLAHGTKTKLTPTETADIAGAKRRGAKSVSFPIRPSEAETRVYQGATYVRGADGQWHLQNPQASGVNDEAPAIARSTSAPIGLSAALRSSGLEAESKTASAKAAAVQLISEVMPKPRKATAKARPKRTVKGTAKPPTKSPVKRRVKAAAKPMAKAPAKRLGKAAQKSPAKATAKRLSKTAAKPTLKASAKGADRPSAKASIRKPSPAKKRAVLGQSSKPAKTVKSAKLAANQSVFEAVANQMAAESLKQS